MRPLVYVCSPYRGDTGRNIAIARAISRKLALAGLYPIAPHLLCPQYLDDDNTNERAAGIMFGRDMVSLCQLLVHYDGDATEGMADEIADAKSLGIPILSMSLTKGEIDDLRDW